MLIQPSIINYNNFVIRIYRSPTSLHIHLKFNPLTTKLVNPEVAPGENL